MVDFGAKVYSVCIMKMKESVKNTSAKDLHISLFEIHSLMNFVDTGCGSGESM